MSQYNMSYSLTLKEKNAPKFMLFIFDTLFLFEYLYFPPNSFILFRQILNKTEDLV